MSKMARAVIAFAATGLWLSGCVPRASADQVSVDCPLAIQRHGTNLAIFWQIPTECATNLALQRCSDLNGPWSTILQPPHPLFLRPDQSAPQFFRTELILPAGCSDASQITQRVRAFAFSWKTNLNPATKFDIRIEPVRDLWEALQVQVLVARFLSEGQDFNQQTFVLYQAALKPLGQSFGGYGLMCGLVKDNSFYFTYSWGSGIHRSHIGKLQIINGVVRLWDAGGFMDQDLFLRRLPNGQIAIEAGTFVSFNGWTNPTDFGRIDDSDPSVTKVLALDGSVLAILAPVDP